MENVVKWLSGHTLTALLIAGIVYAVWYVFAHRKALFYKE